MSSTDDDDVSRYFSSQIERFKAMRLIADAYVYKDFIPESDSDEEEIDGLDSEEFMRLEGSDFAMMNLICNPETFYSYALLPLVYFNAQHKTDFEFHKLVIVYSSNPYSIYIKFEAISPAIGGGLIPLVFQSHLVLPLGWPIRLEVDFCRLHPIECSYTLDDLPLCSSTDHTKSRVIAAAGFSTEYIFTFMSHLPDQGRKFSLKDIVSFEEIAEPTSPDGFDLKYKIIVNTFKTKDASYDLGPLEVVVAFRHDLKEMEMISIVEKEVPNETKDEECRDNVTVP
ncbi:uncharacterized protein LOC124933745 [Impatiens glandulifera]|uniref:uncharacterized protein LOC124933743 n=1 Tax=Impatiens glandulifera TaxID=253017 RepID=UPI001FB078C8|nr:uncharacterized protein LOC124933743 [Impatiens glandulifera]XP_047330135.1 uncharacterized protein LOC124933745 [Impatiens glandulifera]